MLPLIQAEEIKHSVVEYLKATFNFEDKELDQAFEDFLMHRRNGMFKGPYMQMRLPFEKVEENSLEEKELNEALYVKPSFLPYIHQYESFLRLSTRNGHEPEPVILTTGTGSGKTESFLYPLLDYCYQNHDTPGIKAIILYPMNALATDQARRIAEAINEFEDEDGNPVLKGKIRAGLFIGEGKDKKGTRATRMGEDHIIEDRDTLLKSPPDILLTNFKMLDFALLQGRFNGLWKYNFTNTELLKFIALDELHTYDGAKGSDVANLIRRLKLKLGLEKNQIVPVGTSATMAGGEQGKEELVEFFSQVFGVKVNKDAVIEENRVSPEEYFDDDRIIPNVDLNKIENCSFVETDTYQSYVTRQLDYWGYASVIDTDLPAELLKNEWLYQLLRLTNGEVVERERTLNRWREIIGHEDLSIQDTVKLLESLLSLVTYAKNKSGSHKFPFLYVQITYWMRSLNRLVRKLQPTIEFAWESDLNPNDETKVLPPYFCRDCGGSGWIGIKKEHANNFEDDLAKTRSKFFGNSQNKNVFLVSSLHEKAPTEVFADDFFTNSDPINGYVHPHSFYIHDDPPTDEYFKIRGVRNLNGDQIEKICPHCNSRNTLALMGTGVPTLESIAAAQVLATSTDPTEDRYRKLLAFTNGVQDAAHQAGFIENRNYRFGMRHAIQTLVKEADEAISLKDLYGKFETRWKDESSQDLMDEYFYKFLPPDCSARLDIEDYRNKDGSIHQNFHKEYTNRMAWEVWAEYTYRAGIGRTLEKSGASATSFNVDAFEDVYDQMKHWLSQNTLENRVEKQAFLKFLNGFLHRLRIKGGVDHLYLKKYRTERTNYWLITQNTNKRFFLMQNFGRNTRLPKFITLKSGPNTGAFDIVQTNQKQNWFSQFFLKSFPLVGNAELDLINDFYEQLLEYLDANNILDKKVAAGITNFGIREDQIFIEKEVVQYECTSCQHQVNSGTQGAHLLNEMSCLQYRCDGHYKPISDPVMDYYRMVYNRGRALRIFAADHTGLIDRDKREQIEYDFKKQPTYKSINVLVATSTLEMGIDIGDLNITFNSSLPPETANYLQRVGRAGRSSGTSLILNLAGKDEHDLYYYQDPMDMMAGDIKTPACYLEAKDILRRHFTAFCFDSWATEDPENNNLPFNVRLLRLKSIKIGASDFIFNQIASYIEGNKTQLFDQFIEQYKDGIDPNAIGLQSIKSDLASGTFTNPIRNIHQELLNEIGYYEKKRKDINKQLKKLPGTGPEVESLKRERKALSGALYNINRRNVVEYITNIGILPNYAFPETGVSLNAQIRRKKEIDGNTEYKYDQFGDIVRPSSSAITELAPANMFYSQGHMLEAQGLEILSEDDYELHRFCGNCDLVLPNTDVDPSETSCPVCGDGSWSSISNRKKLVRLKGVISVNDKEQSRITDTSDDRQKKNYQKSVHIQIDHKSSEGAHVLKRVPFGIEFFHAVKYLEINTGIREEGFYGTREIDINGAKHPEVGFVVCKTCGKATERMLTDSEIDRKRRSYHFPYCSNRNENYKGQEDAVFSEIYIYRKFNTEALLILLPVQDFRSEERISLFKAGLQLGLKGYFKGKPDHIHVRESEGYNKETQRKEKFLVLYETIPGGTGYLSKLFDTNEFTKVLEEAYDRIAHCSCQDEGKDGCYRCIYTYGNQYERTILSRREAEEFFRDLLEKTDEWNSIESLQNVQGFANNEESDLELMFVDALERLVKRYPGSVFEQQNSRGTKKYKLKLAHKGDDVTYEVWPQNLGNTLQGVGFQTRPDFVLKCISIIRNGHEWTIDEIDTIKPVAIYLDGYHYHATKDHPRFPSDLRIRNAISQSERYYHWTLTWTDFNEKLFTSIDEIGVNLIKNKVGPRLLDKVPMFKGLEFEDILAENNITRLTHLLFNPLYDVTPKNWSSLILFNQQENWIGKCYENNSVEEAIELKDLTALIESQPSGKKFSHLDKIQLSDEANVQAFVLPETFKISGFSTYKSIDGWEKENWEKFWRYYNLLQFHQVYTVELNAVKDETPLIENDDVFENFDESLHDIVRILMHEQIEFNEELDFDLMEGDAIIASAELGSNDKKFFVNPFDEESRQIFIENGYREFTIDNFKIEDIL